MTRRISAVAVCCSSASREVAVARLQLLEQPRVLDGDDGLVGEGLQHPWAIARSRRISPVAVCCSSDSARAVSARLCAALFLATARLRAASPWPQRAPAPAEARHSPRRDSPWARSWVCWPFWPLRCPPLGARFNERGVEKARSIAACCSAGAGKSRHATPCRPSSLEVTGGVDQRRITLLPFGASRADRTRGDATQAATMSRTSARRASRVEPPFWRMRWTPPLSRSRSARGEVLGRDHDDRDAPPQAWCCAARSRTRSRPSPAS